MLDGRRVAGTHGRMESIQKLCVYCGSGPGRDPVYLDAAARLGRAMAQHDLGLVYGGGSLGLMGETARSVLSAGGHVTGVIPDFLVKREKMLTDVQQLIVTQDMHERKMTMFEHADGFVALPGGVGTLEELVEVSTWAQLSQHDKPIILANIKGYWDPLIELMDHMRAEQFIRAGLELRLDIVSQPEEVVTTFLRRLRQRKGKRLEKSLRGTA